MTLAWASVLAACAPTSPTQAPLEASTELTDPAALRAWMTEQHREFDARSSVTTATAPSLPELPDASVIDPAAAGRSAVADPFDARRLSDRVPIPGQRPGRTDPPLQALPLSSLRMVGSLRRGEEVVALVQADVQIYQVPVGALLGKSQAQVLRITEEGITVQEPLRGVQGQTPVQSPVRTITLPLQGR
ncbi:pilus assembly protein PilP [Hylemonella sp. W303a]|uniref:pilus assembly protein PilP n=1 Tax=Hylemonella sp. W303a TaxID=3389873 RepID=UPI00396B03D3